jgi:hypothetical protein
MKGAAYEYTDWLDRIVSHAPARAWWELEAAGRFAEWEAAREQRATNADADLVAAMEDAGRLILGGDFEAGRALGRIVQCRKDAIRTALAAATANDLRAVERAAEHEMRATLRVSAPVLEMI